MFAKAQVLGKQFGRAQVGTVGEAEEEVAVGRYHIGIAPQGLAIGLLGGFKLALCLKEDTKIAVRFGKIRLHGNRLPIIALGFNSLSLGLAQLAQIRQRIRIAWVQFHRTKQTGFGLGGRGVLLQQLTEIVPCLG